VSATVIESRMVIGTGPVDVMLFSFLVFIRDILSPGYDVTHKKNIGHLSMGYKKY
jgi:hypothetical protein